MMCGKNTPYCHKFGVGCVIMLICVIISMSIYIGYSGGSEANVVLNGGQDEAIIQQSSGLHLLEVNGSIGCKGNWTYAEYVCVVLGFLFILKCTHLAHYCFLTKSLVKKKVTRDVGQQMKNLNNQPEGNNVVIVPGIV